jgi:hypothetical protein
MALKSCRECGTAVSTEAKSCPSCGAKSPTRRPVNKLALVGAVGLFLLIGNLLAPTPDPAVEAARATSTRARRLFSDAEIECHFGIKRQLKAPESADFTTEAGFDPDSGQYVNVTGTVTAVNSFNAPLTTRVGCRWDTTAKRLVYADLIE